ncbi:MAG TPA: hypothetical protein VKA08_06585 [Balneolales bacterium]|nr:hypothetical protein [Balneolales bacterium]
MNDAEQNQSFTLVWREKAEYMMPMEFIVVCIRAMPGRHLRFLLDSIPVFPLMQESISRLDYLFYACGLMKSHVHLAIFVVDAPFFKIVRNLSFRSPGLVHKIMGRICRLFQGQGKVVLVDKDLKYIEIGMVYTSSPA